jgi:hypothetical protein
MDLVEKDNYGAYAVSEDADLGFLDNYLFFEHGSFPRMIFYAVYITGLLIVYTLAIPFDFGAHNVMALVIALSAAAFFWIEVMRSRRLLKGT